MNTNKERKTNTALEVIDFDFYGDLLIALQDNSTGEIYTSITQVLRGIGFTDKQIEYQRKKFVSDPVISKGTLKFSGVDLNMPSVDEVWCISNRKLPIALTKITITPKMKQNQPGLSSKLELYQDKCADVLASVFIDHNIPSQDLSQVTNAVATLADTMNVMITNMTTMQQDIRELKQTQRNRYLLEKRYPSAWYKKMAPKYKMLMEYFDCTRSELYSSIYKELEDTYSVDINQIHEDYCYENHLLKDECYPMDAIEHNTKLRDSLSLLIDFNLVKFGLQTEEQIKNFKRPTLFDKEPENLQL